MTDNLPKTKKDKFYTNYVEQMSIPAAASSRKSIMYGVAYGSSQGVIFFAYAGCFYFGTWLIQEGILPPTEYNNIYKVNTVLLNKNIAKIITKGN